VAARILLVEDEPLIAWNLRILISGWGFSILGPVERGRDAIEAFDREGADLALLDIFLADSLSGIEVARHIRSTSATPFIFITASRDMGTMELAEAESPAAMISKPYEEGRLKAEVFKALGLEI